MANRIRGEASFTASDDKVYTLVIDYNAFAEAEDVADMQINDLLKAMREQPRLKHMKAILYGALRERHPEFTPASTIALMETEGEKVGRAIAQALENAFPQPVGGPAPNPPARPRSTGTNSRARGPKKA